MPFATAWMDLEGIMLNEISQRKTNTILFQLYIESEKKKKNKYKKTDSDTENKLVVARAG